MTRQVRMAVMALGMLGMHAVQAESSRYVEFDDAHLVRGRHIWLGTCEGCHGYGVAGAPVPMQPADWQARVGKPKSLLYDHAIIGFFGPGDTMMPERGGNPSLTDAEVMSAVDYMVELANFYITQQKR